jgi:hypothetical protein
VGAAGMNQKRATLRDCEINGEKRMEPAKHSNDTNEESPIRVIRVIRWHLLHSL